ncbi:hypothetical protein [Janthinobacterium agaricidamnosum]|uniref:hypothetical protein n=1 Tax=Janthinobacterium agaricidamnosum TaxID=55508 RepID=UPI000774D2AF|nr:hypothetical protein [Janthinobacterium agaricidamnosum]
MASSNIIAQAASQNSADPDSAKPILLATALNNPPVVRAATPAVFGQGSAARSIQAEPNAALAVQLKLHREDPARRAAVPGAMRMLAAGDAIPAPIAGCPEIQPGFVYTDSTPAAGGLKCYQFVVNDKTKIDSKALLPDGINAVGYLFEVDPATGQIRDVELDFDASPNNPLLMQSISQSARLVLVVQAANGPGGQAYQFGAWSSQGFDAFEVNDKISKPALAPINQTVNANIDVPGTDQDYYFFPLKRNQSSADITINFTAQQSAGIRLGRKNTDGSYAWADERPLAAVESGRTLTLNGIPRADANGVYGVIVRVSGVNPAAPAVQPYTVHVKTPDFFIADYDSYNSENLTHWYPKFDGYGVEAAHYLDLSVKVSDTEGNPVEGQAVLFVLDRNKYDGETRQQYVATTDRSGRARYRAEMSACTGETFKAYNYGPFGDGTRWNGEAQLGQYQILLFGPSSQPVEKLKVGPIRFYRICKEVPIHR